MIDNQFIKKPSGFNKQRLDSFVKSVKTNKQDVQKKELDEALALHTQLVAKEMMQRAMQLPAFPDLQQAYINQGMQQMQPMQPMPQIPQAAYGMEIGAVMPSINSPFTYPSQQNLTPPNSDMFKKNADKYEGKGMSAFKNLFTTAANAVLNPAIQEYNQKVYNAKQKAAADEEETDVPEAKLGGLIKAQKGLTWAEYLKKSGITDKDILALTQEQIDQGVGGIEKQEAIDGKYDIKNDIYNSTLSSLIDAYNRLYPLSEDGSRSTIKNAMSDYYVYNNYKDYGLTKKEADSLYGKESIDPALNQKYIDMYVKSRNKYNNQDLKNKGNNYRDVPVEWVDAYPKQTLKGIENTNTEFPGQLRMDAGNMFRMPVLYDDQTLGQQDASLLGAKWMRDYYNGAPGAEDNADKSNRDQHYYPAIYPKPNYSVTGVNPTMQTYQYKDEYGNIVTGEQPAMSMEDSQNLGDNQYYDYNTGPWVKNYNNKMKLYDITQQNLARLGQYDPNYRIQSMPLTEDDRRVAGYENQYINDPTVGFYQEFENEGLSKKPCKDCGTLQGSTVSADADNYYQTYGVQYPSKGILSKKDLERSKEHYTIKDSGNPGHSYLWKYTDDGKGGYMQELQGSVFNRDFLNDEQQVQYDSNTGGDWVVNYDPNVDKGKVYQDQHIINKTIEDERGWEQRDQNNLNREQQRIEQEKAYREQWEKEQREKQNKKIKANGQYAYGGTAGPGKPKIDFTSKTKSSDENYITKQIFYDDNTAENKNRRTLKGFITGAPKPGEPGGPPKFAMGGDLPKAQIMGTTGSTFGPSTGKPKEVQDAETALQENLDRYQSDEPVYDNQGNLITKEQLQQATRDAYNAYYQAVGQAVKDNPTPSFGGPGDMSYMYNYPTRDGLNLPNVNVSGPGVTPELYNSTAAAQKYTNMGSDYPGLGAYIGLSPQRRLESNDMNYSPNYKAMYNDALSKGQYDRFETNITANPTVAGSILDKLGVGKMFATRNYDISQNILPEGQSILDPERLAENQRRQTLLANQDLPGGGLFQTDEMDPYIWENRTRRDRRDVLEGAGIDPSRKNLRRLGEDYFENLKQDRIREDAEASREGYENTLAEKEAATKRDVSIATIGKRPRNAWDLVGTGVQSVPPAQNVVVPPPVNATQPNVVNPNPTTSPTAPYTPPAFDLGRTQNQIVKTEGEWFGTKPAGLALPDNYDKDWRNYAIDKSAGPFMYPDANKVGQDWNAVMAKYPKKKAMWESFNDMPAPIREIAADQVFNAGYDPRVMVLGAAGVDKGYTGKGSPVTSNPEYRSWLKTNADQLWKDNKDLINQQYADDPQAFTSSITDNRKIIYKNLRTEDLPGGVLTDFPSNSGGPGTQYNAWSGRSGAVQDYVDKTYFDPSTGYTAPQYFKQAGGTMLPMFQIEGEYPGIDWEPFQTGPFAKKKGPFFNNDRNKITLGLPEAFPDANKMRTFFDTGEAPLTAEAFSKELDKYVPKYTGQEPQELATATGSAKIKSNIAPTTYLTMANTTGKYLADNIFGRDERKRAQEQYKKSRFLENNLALTSPDTQFDPRLRGFDRTTDAFAGAPYAGAQVQYSQPLIAMGQRGTEIPITMQEGGVYTLTPEMIKQIIENGGEIEYVDESNNFANPFNQ